MEENKRNTNSNSQAEIEDRLRPLSDGETIDQGTDSEAMTRKKTEYQEPDGTYHASEDEDVIPSPEDEAEIDDGTEGAMIDDGAEDFDYDKSNYGPEEDDREGVESKEGVEEEDEEPEEEDGETDDYDDEEDLSNESENTDHQEESHESELEERAKQEVKKKFFAWLLTNPIFWGLVLIALLLLIGVLVLLAFNPGSTSSVTDSGTGITTICLDAGHGGADSGAANGSFKESEMNLKIVLGLKPKLESAGYRVVTTRLNNDYLDPSNNSAEESRARSEYCSNEGADLMYRVHLDSSKSPQRTFHIAPRPDQTNIYDISLSYAEGIHSKMISTLGSLVVGGGSPLTDGGVVKESVDYIPDNPLQGNIKADELSLPIVWLEALAINTAGIGWIESNSNRDALTTAIADGFLEAIPPGSGSFGENVVAKAKTQLGKPYVSGGCHGTYKDPAYEDGCPSFDCSGLTRWAWWWGSGQMVDIDGNTSLLNANKNDTSKYIYFTDVSQAQPGDLVLYTGHVGLYSKTENGTHYMVHAPNSKKTVEERNIYGTPVYLRPLVK